jgi:hypothetical protein
VVRAIHINGRLVQFAWRALATIVFAVLVAITMRLMDLRSKATSAGTLMPATSYCKASRLTRFWRRNLVNSPKFRYHDEKVAISERL